MAKPIQPIDRQVATPNANIRPNNAYATLGEATAELGNMVATKLEDQAVYYSGLAGEEDALAGKAPKTLLPFGRASAAYTNAVIKTEARQLTNQGRQMINQTYSELSNPANFNAQTPAEFDAKVTGITQGILDNTRRENRGAVAAALDEYAGAAKLRILDDAIKYDNEQTEASFNNELALAQEQLREAIFSKDKNSIAIAQRNVGEILDDYAQINQRIMDKLPEITKKINSQAKTDMVVAEYLSVYQQGKQATQDFITDLATKPIPGLTTQEQLEATAQVLKIHKQNITLTNAYEAEVFSETTFKIDSDQYTSVEDVAFDVGDRLDAADTFRLQSHWIAHDRAAKKKRNAVGMVLAARKAGPQEVAKLSGEILNEAYEQMVFDGVAAYNSTLAPDQQPISDFTLLQKMQNIVLPNFGAPVKDYQIELAYGLKSADQVKALDALQAYKYGYANREVFGDVLKGLDSDANNIAQFALSTGAKSEVDEINLIGQAQQNIKDTSDTTRIARQKRLDSFYTGNDGSRQIDRFYKATFGASPGQAQFDASFGTFQRLFDTYFMGVADGNADVSMKMTAAQMRDWGTSKWGEPNDIMYTPIEKAVSFSNLGYWLDNQVGLALNRVLKNHETEKTGIKRPKWMVEQIPEGNVSEKDLMEKNYLSTTRGAVTPSNQLFVVTDEMLNQEGLFNRELSAIVDGVERRIYITSTDNTRQSASGESVYQFYYKDDYGVAQFLPDPYNPLDVAQYSVQPLSVMLPEVYDTLRSEDFDSVANSYAQAEAKMIHPTNLLEDIIPFIGIGKRVKQRIYTEQNKERIKQEFLSKEETAKNKAKRKLEAEIKFVDGKVVEEDIAEDNQ